MILCFPSPEFDNAVAAVCHGLATESEMQALNELLRNKSGARDEYLLRVEMHARLASNPDLFSLGLSANDPVGLPDEVTAPQIISYFHKSKNKGVKKPVIQILALAAGLCLTAIILWNVWGSSGKSSVGNAVAVLTRTINARWGDIKKPIRVGGALEPGILRLESGLAQVVFYSGARVVIEGPATLQILSPMEAVCPDGKLLAEVPQPAKGFRLKTTQIDVVDLGTTFGIQVTNGQSEVHVFKGKVELSSAAAAKKYLDEGHAAVVQGSALPRLIQARAGDFTAMFDLQKQSMEMEAIRYDQWRMASAKLDQDPTLVVHLDFENLNDSDWKLRNAAEQNRSVTDAVIVGCQRVQGRWPEKQGLEFQGINDRVRLAVPGDFESLTLAAWVRIRGFDRNFNSLFMCDGFEPGAVHWLIRNDGILSFTVKGPGSGNFQIMATPAVFGSDKFGVWVHLAVVLDGKNGQLTHFLNGLPVGQHKVKLGPPYRLGAAELGNWFARSGSKSNPFLIRNLSGSIDEFELFGRVLSKAEIYQLYQMGKPQSGPEPLISKN